MKLKIAGLVLVCASFTSSAITLGRVQGVAFLGQPLDVAIQVQFEGDETAASSCFDAEVFHADTRLEPSRVRVTVENMSQSQLALIKVVSSTIVDEPIVTVYLKVGCNTKTTRRYVLFSEIPNDIQPTAAALGLRVTPLPLITAPVASPAPVVQSPTAAVLPSAPGAALPAVALQTPTAAKPETAAPPKPAVAAAPKAPSQASPVAPAKPNSIAVKKPPGAPVSSQSRLKLDTLELLKERVAQLESTPPPVPVPSPEAELEAQRMKKLEGDVQALLTLASNNEKNLAEMRERLLRAESSKYDNALVYALAGLLLLAVGSLVFLLRKRKSSAAPVSLWSESVQETTAVQAKYADPAAVSAKPVPIVLPSTFANLDVDLDAVEAAGDSKKADLTSQATLQATFNQATKFELPPNPERRSIGRDFSPSVISALRSINSEELFDIRQQAEFFVSLGQTEQAIDVLNNLIQDGGEHSPMVYLDLLKIFHNLGRRSDYANLSHSFNRIFNGRVPDFDNFANEGKSLESYRRVIAHISALWPSEKVLEALEECMYREDTDNSEQFFDLGAFRDLILLHAVAILIIEETHADAPIEMSDRRLALTKEMPMNEAPQHFDYTGNSTKIQPEVFSGLDVTNYSSKAPDLDLSEVDFDFSRSYFAPTKEGTKEDQAEDTDFEPPELSKNSPLTDSKKP